MTDLKRWRWLSRRVLLIGAVLFLLTQTASAWYACPMLSSGSQSAPITYVEGMASSISDAEQPWLCHEACVDSDTLPSDHKQASVDISLPTPTPTLWRAKEIAMDPIFTGLVLVWPPPAKISLLHHRFRI